MMSMLTSILNWLMGVPGKIVYATNRPGFQLSKGANFVKFPFAL